VILQFIEQKIELAGASNIRDLGGYPTVNGGRTRKGVYFRSDSLHNLQTEDITKIKELGVTMQLDLRSSDEISAYPSKLRSLEGIEYLNISLFDDMQSSGFRNIPHDMVEMYCGLLNHNREKFAAIFRALLSTNGGCIINCTAGKDRTGIVVMLLLNLVRVSDEAITFDYSVSAANMAGQFTYQKKLMAEKGYVLPNYIFLSKPDYIKKTLEHLKRSYIDAQGYIKLCGLGDKEIEQLRTRLYE
jgi:protein-tyrosine phosphatase